MSTTTHPTMEAAAGKATSPIPTLLPHHLAELAASGISRELAEYQGIYSEPRFDRLASLLDRKKWPATWGTGLVFPYLDPQTGIQVHVRIKPERPAMIGGKPCKYLQPAKSPVRAYFPRSNGKPVEESSIVLLVEGEKKSLAATAAGFRAVGLGGVDCWQRPKSARMIPDLEAIRWKGTIVYIVFDSDIVENPRVERAARLLGARLKAEGAEVKLVILPPGPPGEDGKPTKVGLDDFLLQHGREGLLRLMAAAQEPEPPIPEDLAERPDANAADPAEEAKAMLAADTADGLSRLRFWRGEFLRWKGGSYGAVPDDEIDGRVVMALSRRFTRVRGGVVCDVTRHLKAQSMLPGSVSAPTWLAGEEPCPAGEVVPCRNGLLRLSVDGKHVLIPPTPRFFTTGSRDYAYRPDAPRPERWLRFLDEILPDDSVSVELLQEFAGYLLTPDNQHNKSLCVCGPTRAGKGVYGEVCRMLVGPENTAAPMLHSLGGDFGLAPLLNKALMVVSDARLSNKADQASVVEGLLRISGDDPIEVHRKHRAAVNVVLGCRVLILTNEMPRLLDPSGAIAGRMLFVRLTKSFLGREDRALKPTLKNEIEGILLWAIEGWRRLRLRGCFLEPESSEEMNQQMQDLASPVSRFVRERCILGDVHQIERSELYRAWVEWCAEVGDKYPGDDGQFGKCLLAACPNVHGDRRRQAGQRSHTYRGIDLDRF